MPNHGKSKELYYDHEVPGISIPRSFNFAVWKRAHIWKTDLQNGMHGYGSLCHVRLQGTGLTPGNTWNVVACQCTGALVMQQRELLRHIEHGNSALTPQGAARVASEVLGKGVAECEVHLLNIPILLASMHPSLLNPLIGCSTIASPLSDKEKENWKALSNS